MDQISSIARVIAQMRDPKAVERLLRELLTKSEEERLSLRWDIVRLLSEGKSQRKVAQELGVSLCKITRGARQLKRGRSMLKKVFEPRSSPSQSTP